METKKDYLKEEINKKCLELEKTVFNYIPRGYILYLLNEGALIQQEIDIISDIEEAYCLDSFEEAKEVWQGMLEFNKKYPPGSIRPKSPGQLMIEQLHKESCPDCGQKIFIDGKRHKCDGEYAIEDK